MSEQDYTFRARPYLWLIRLIGVIVPRRLRPTGDRNGKLSYNREAMLAEWDRLDWQTQLALAQHERFLGCEVDAVVCTRSFC